MLSTSNATSCRQNQKQAGLVTLVYIPRRAWLTIATPMMPSPRKPILGLSWEAAAMTVVDLLVMTLHAGAKSC